MIKKILVLFTGGTIGSKTEGHTIDVNDSSPFLLLEKYKDKANIEVDFEPIEPFTLLSENLMPSDWHVLQASLQKVNYDDYAGIIITHGTDTLPYTTAAISYLNRHSTIPIVFVASNFPMAHPKSKAVDNFSDAVSFIVNTALPGIFVVFADKKGETLVHLGSRLLSSLPFADEFDSVKSVIFGKMVNGQFQYHQHRENPSIGEIRKKRPNLRLEEQFTSDILYVRPYPGVGYGYYDFEKRKPRAVVHDLYHSGTASTREVEDPHYSLKAFVEYCSKHDVDVYIAPREHRVNQYSSAIELMEYGVNQLENIGLEAAMVKLMLAYGTFTDKKKREAFLFSEELFFENLPLSLS
ncbi:asparaginase [Bacillus solitudinis]|uniref:asparaginase n=1 Tax=Bacillus solitudinis TaxID=2014074 RepID=UPI0012FD7320|nr:asparaginase domain-containing protein [Bacillus solitudinis]